MGQPLDVPIIACPAIPTGKNFKNDQLQTLIKN